MAAAIRPRPSFCADAKNRLLPGEIELAEPPWTYLVATLSFVDLRLRVVFSPPRHGCGWVPHNAVENRSPLWRSGSHASRLYPANWFPADWCWNPRTLTPMLVLLKLTKPACVFSCEFSLLLRLQQPAGTRSSSSSDSTTGWMSSSMVLSLDVSGAVLRPRYN